MRALGLPGESFIPLIIGFGCNVPAILASRTLQNERERMLTIMMSPFMACSARLAIFAVFCSAFFPVGGARIVFILYVLGIMVAVLTGYILRKTIMLGPVSPLCLELPDYHWPKLYDLACHAWRRLRHFIWRAGRVIVPLCLLIGVANHISLRGHLLIQGGQSNALLSHIGRWLTPVFSPLGIHHDNWPATVGLLTGILAKEVVVATLNTLYATVGHLGNVNGQHFSVWLGLQAAFHSVLVNLKISIACVE